MALVSPILYSTGTELSYNINMKYYRDRHYVWCTSDFDSQLQPGSSNPRILCMHNIESIIHSDAHSAQIEQNKAGLLRGADAQLNLGTINQDQADEINWLVTHAEFKDFYPIVYIVFSKSAIKRAQLVAAQDSASILSEEYIIPDLSTSEFNLIRMRDIMYNILPPNFR